MIDLDSIRDTPLMREPFDHLVVPHFIDRDALAAIHPDFPVVNNGGSFPLSELSCGSSFRALVDELQGDALRSAVGAKFDLDLTERPTLLTVRGQARAKDGRIHTDAKWKLVTLLLYLNREWPHAGGHLRLLRTNASLEDFAADVAPVDATAVLFRCTDDAWHGHTPHVGERRAVQVNWVENESWLLREQKRHRWSSRIKRIWSGSRAPRA